MDHRKTDTKTLSMHISSIDSEEHDSEQGKEHISFFLRGHNIPEN
jgi:hypothetical protein